MILYSSRSAKSVACSRLNVIGVSAFFFFPVFVAAFTSADEFHSVTNTRWPSALSHFASNPSCVVFPDPSIPSTTNSLPGYSCGCVRVFNISVATDLESQRLTGHSFKRRRMPRGSPELQLGVARRPQLQQIVVAAIVQPREAVVLALRRGLTMIARDERDCFDFVRFEAAKVAVLDEVVRMLVM